ncbi:hypothetical protein D3C84_971470 [compost metagenome]
MGGVEVVLRQGQARFRLIKVGGAADATIGAQADLVVDPQVRLQVVGGQGHQFAALEHFEVHLDGAQGQAFGGTAGEVGAGVDNRSGASDFIGGIETVEQHLPQAQFGLGVPLGLRVVAIGRQAAGRGVVAVAAPIAGIQVQ